MDNANKLLNDESCSFNDDLDEVAASFAPEEEVDDCYDGDGDEEDSGNDCEYGDEMDWDHESALESVYGPNDGMEEDAGLDGCFED